MKKLKSASYSLIVFCFSSLTITAHAAGYQCDLQPQAIELPRQYNTPDGATLDANGDLFVSIPNFNNDALLEAGKIAEASPASIIMINEHNQVTNWYEFRVSDMHPETGRIGPMDIAFGPDGNLYVADMQIFWSGERKSRLLRINVKNGQAKSMDVVADGFIVANGMTWSGETLYVTESILEQTPQVAEGQTKPALQSAVYAFNINEFQNNPVTLAAYDEKNPDSHLFAVFESSNRMGFGADGITIDGRGDVYTSIVEDGLIYKTTLTTDGKAAKTELFSKGDMDSADGITWRQKDQNIYVADFLGNAVHQVNPNGQVNTIYKNGDTTGENGALDQPSDVQFRGDQLIVVNMDMPIAPPEFQTNTLIDQPYGLSVFDMK